MVCTHNPTSVSTVQPPRVSNLVQIFLESFGTSIWIITSQTDYNFNMRIMTWWIITELEIVEYVLYLQNKLPFLMG